MIANKNSITLGTAIYISEGEKTIGLQPMGKFTISSSVAQRLRKKN